MTINKAVKYLSIGVLIFIVLFFLELYLSYTFFTYKKTNKIVESELFDNFNINTIGDFTTKAYYENRLGNGVISGEIGEKYNVLMYKAKTSIKLPLRTVFLSVQDTIEQNEVKTYSHYINQSIVHCSLNARVYQPRFKEVYLNVTEFDDLKELSIGENYLLYQINSDQFSIGAKENNQDVTFTLDEGKKNIVETKLLIYLGGEELYFIVLEVEE